MAAPLLPADGRVVGAISLVAAVERLAVLDLDKLSQLVKRAAGEIGVCIGAGRHVAHKCYIVWAIRSRTMSTTTIRIDEELKSRVAVAAQRAGKTAHAFIVDAIAQTVEQAELDEAFDQIADERWAALLANGKSVAWSDAKAWLDARARGERPRRPAARLLKR